MRHTGPRLLAVLVAATWCAALATPAALAGHSVQFDQPRITAGEDVTLELRVPEAGADHNPEGTQDHHTRQVKITVPPEFSALGCVPPDGWDCVRTGELFRYFRDSPLGLERDSSYSFGVYVTAPEDNGTWGFRTEQVYNDGHETRFTVEGGTAPTVEVEGASAPEPSPAPATPSPTPSPEPAATSPADAAPSSPTPSPDPSTAPPSPAPTTPPEPTPSPTADTAETPGDPTPSARPTAAPNSSPGPDPAGDAVTGDDTADVPGGLDDLERAALSLLVVSGTWAVVEFRARRDGTS